MAPPNEALRYSDEWPKPCPSIDGHVYKDSDVNLRYGFDRGMFHGPFPRTTLPTEPIDFLSTMKCEYNSEISGYMIVY